MDLIIEPWQGVDRNKVKNIMPVAGPRMGALARHPVLKSLGSVTGS